MRQLLDPQVVWHAGGRNALTGDYRGVEEVLGFFGRTMEHTQGGFRVSVKEVLVNDQGAVVVQRSSAQRNGKSLDDGASSCSTSATARRSRSGSTGVTHTRPTRSSLDCRLIRSLGEAARESDAPSRQSSNAPRRLLPRSVDHRCSADSVRTS